MAGYVVLHPGDPAPTFRARTSANPRYAFDTVAGRYIVLCFFATAGDEIGRKVMSEVQAKRAVFNDLHACFFGISHDPGDEREHRARDSLPGLRFFWDFDGAVGKLYGALPSDTMEGAQVQARRMWVVLDPTLRVMAVLPFDQSGGNASKILDYVAGLPPPAQFAGFEVSAPILVLPNVFEPQLCSRLMKLYEAHGGAESGFMREIDGKTVAVHDHGHKRRRDYIIEDKAIIGVLQNRIQRRIAPEIRKVHQFDVTRMERYIVCCYAAEDKAHFAGAFRGP